MKFYKPRGKLRNTGIKCRIASWFHFFFNTLLTCSNACGWSAQTECPRYVPFLAHSPISMSAVSVTTYKAVSSGREVRKESRWLPQSLRALLMERGSPKECVLPPGMALCDISPATRVKHKKSLPLFSPGHPVFYKQLHQHYQGRQQLLRPAVPPPNWALVEKETNKTRSCLV